MISIHSASLEKGTGKSDCTVEVTGLTVEARVENIVPD